MTKLNEMRFAHTEGRCDLTYTPDGSRILTCGADGEVRVWTGIDDDDPASHVVGDEAFAVACGQDKFFVAASGTNTVQAYDFPEGTSKGLMSRFTADATTLDVRSSNLAAGSGDMTIKVVETESFKQTLFKGHTAPILSVAIGKEYLLSSSCDGSVCVWKLGGDEGSQVHVWRDLLPKSSDNATSITPAKLSWQPQEKLLSIPINQGVKIFTKDTWEEFAELKPTSGLGQNELMAVTAWSGDGTLVAAGTTAGQIFIWKLEGSELVFETKTNGNYPICSLVWNPKKGEIAFINNQGYWGSVDSIGVKSTLPPTTKDQPAVQIVEDKDELNEEELAAALFDDDEDDNENSFSIRKIKKDTGFLDEESNQSRDELPSSPKGALDNKVLQQPPQPMPPPPPPQIEIDLQEPFQSGSTPVRLSSRYMVWNSVGTVKAYSEEENTIEVDFHDASVHHPIHISNAHGHTMADLSTEVLVLACEANEDEMAPSRIAVHHLLSADTNNCAWSVEMPEKEEVMVVCAGEGWIAAATDRRQLRLFSAAGVQREVLSLPGPVLTLSGHGDRLMVAVHTGAPLLGNQTVSFAIFNVLGSKKKHLSPNYQPLPMAPNSELSWMGFSDEGTPCIVDSAGQVRLLNTDYGYGTWMQICDTRANVKGKSDHHFVVGLNVVEKGIRSILCKGSRYPQTVPRPTIVIVPFSLPLCEAVTERSLLEEQYWKDEIIKRALAEDSEKSDLEQAQAATMIKLFALACKSDQDSRALDVCKMMDTNTIQVAIKYATKNRKMLLANKISQLAFDIQEKEEQQKREREEEASQWGQDSTADMFETRDDDELRMEDDERPTNPIIEAKIKKSLAQGKAKSVLQDSQSMRNPFKKSSTQSR